MLTIYGMNTIKQESFPNLIKNPDTAFEAFAAEIDLNSDFSRKVITDIQHIDVMDTSKSTKSILAMHEIALPLLATGTKNLLVCKYHAAPLACRMGRMGENCYKWLIDIAEERDLGAVCVHCLSFTDEDLRGRKVYFADIGRYADDAASFDKCMLDLIYLGCFTETPEDEVAWLKEIGEWEQ